MKMVISMKEAGPIIRDMVKVLSGSAIPRINSGDSIQVIGRTTRKKEEERCSSNRAIVMMVCGWTASLMEKVE